ncbi:MAG: 3-ketoacyl-ACP reductase [Phycisphaerae bacterium]
MSNQKVALVTGGSRGIGRAISQELANEGYVVVINYHENLAAAELARTMIEENGGKVDLCQGDISAKSHRDLIVSNVMERFGRIDFLVNNAGIAPSERMDILETDEASFDNVLNVNLKAPYYMTQRVAREMVALREAGTIDWAGIVNISSLRRYTPAGNYGEYCISKAGVSMITKLFAVRLAEYGINVYEISPGIIETDMTSSDAVKDFYNAKFSEGLAPINRWGKPEDVARAVGAIARQSFPFSTGSIFDIDGGFHIHQV